MSALTQEDVRHIAALARLKLTDEEVSTFTPELGAILGYINQLTEVDTNGVTPTAQVTGTTSVLRKDELRDEPLAEADDLLATSALPIRDHQIETPSAHG